MRVSTVAQAVEHENMYRIDCLVDLHTWEAKEEENQLRPRTNTLVVAELLDHFAQDCTCKERPQNSQFGANQCPYSSHPVPTQFPPQFPPSSHPTLVGKHTNTRILRRYTVFPS